MRDRRQEVRTRIHVVACLFKAVCLSLLCLPAWSGDGYATAQTNNLDGKTLDFGIFWPPKAPAEGRTASSRPLLKGKLVVDVVCATNQNTVAHVRVELSRPSDAAGREFWNKTLAFPEYDWMRYVRVWDAEQKWLWPNLAYLLRLHGLERVERYGGVDPGKGVDNDFAAVIIRKYDPAGQTESADTKQEPLVSAEWYPMGAPGTNKQTIVHSVQSDEFALALGRVEERTRGLATVWLIYADFMGAKVPDGWPKELEYAGGILACFKLEWDLGASQGERLKVRQVVPPRSTGFDWERWTTRTLSAHDSKSTSKLSDAAKQ